MSQILLQVLHPDCFGEEDCYGQNVFPKIEADLTLEYYPFSAAELKVKSCDQLTSEGALPVCGLVLDNGDSCTATSTSFWAACRAIPSAVPPHTRRVICSTWCPCMVGC